LVTFGGKGECSNPHPVRIMESVIDDPYWVFIGTTRSFPPNVTTDHGALITNNDNHLYDMYSLVDGLFHLCLVRISYETRWVHLDWIMVDGEEGDVQKQCMCKQTRRVVLEYEFRGPRGMERFEFRRIPYAWRYPSVDEPECFRLMISDRG
jgi:hypothetical protein